MSERQCEFEISQSDPISIYVHRNMKDPNEEYSTRKKRKANEVIVYKDLRDRNPLLTIYRAVSYDQVEKQNTINKIISWLQNQQKTILPRSEKDKLNEKCFLKHILTYISTKFLDSNSIDIPKQNQTLFHYVNEAIEKQCEGFVNNILMMVQPIKNLEQMEYVNYFASAVAYQMKQSKKSISVESSNMRCNKTIFINLTGKESLQNLEKWEQFLDKQDEFIYFSFIKMVGEQEQDFSKQFDQYSTYIKNMEMANFNYFFIPYLCPLGENNNILHGQLVKAFFQNFMHNRIEKFSHKAYIALSLSLSDYIEYDPYAIQFLINNLTKLSNDKLMIHIDVEINEDDINYSSRLTQLMNLCYSSFQEQNITIQKLMPEDKIKLSELIIRLKKIFLFLNLDNQYKALQYCHIAAQNLEVEIKKPEIQHKLLNLQTIFYKKSSQIYKVICPVLEDNHLLTPYTQIIIDYQDEIIILYNDRDIKYLYYVKMSIVDLYNQNSVQKIRFTNLTNLLGPKNVQNQIVFYCNFQIFIIYGNQQNVFLMEGLKYDLIKNEITKLIFKNQEKPNQGIFHSKIAIQKFSNEQLIEKLKSRIQPTVCIENSGDQVLKVVLFGGENIDIPQIMNLIEYIEIKDSYFISGILDKSNLFKDISFKPFPGQSILSVKFQNDIFNLILPGNDTLRRKPLNHPINSQFSQNAILMKKGCLDFYFQNIPINYYGVINYGLNYISNSQQNYQLIFQSEALAVWRIIYTQTMKIDSIQKLKMDYSKQWNPETQEVESFFQNKNNFQEQHDEIVIILAYLIQMQKQLNEDDIKDILERKQKFDNSRQKSEQVNQQIEYFKKKLYSGQLFDLDGKPFIQKDNMQVERGNINEAFQQQQDFFKQDVLNIYDGDMNQLYSIAYENYLFLDISARLLSVRQYTYQIADALSLPQIDLTSSQSQQQQEQNLIMKTENYKKNK